MTLPTFKAFLSHRYKSPVVNQRLFDLLTAFAVVQFEVDVGNKPTNVTRLERFVRDADAFVGIYPLPAGDEVRPSRAALMEESKYFRLELDMAARSGKPGIVFVDMRYGNAITVPAPLRECRYDHREIANAGPLRGEALFLEQARGLANDVAAVLQRLGGAATAPNRDRVGMLWGADADADGAELERLKERLLNMSLEPVVLDASRGADGDFMQRLHGLDWMVTDISAPACASGLPGFVHGRFVPQMRLVRSPSPDLPARSPLEDGLLKGFEAGYPKDIVRWHGGDSLVDEFDQRLAVLYEPRTYIGTAAEAAKYFAGAALRKETVFLSYAGEDRALVEGLAKALRGVFQSVFDYRDDGQSIVPGSRWIDEIFTKLVGSALAVPVVSPAYLASPNCMHEAREIIATADNRNLRVVPVKLREGELELPPLMRDMQYLRGWEYPDAKLLAQRVVMAFDELENRAATAATR